MISIDEINKLKAENAKLNAIIDSYQPRLQRYKDILQEIKEIAKCDCGYCKNYRCPRMNNILDLITKAEEE
jgi:hypothetical protein